jgi:hypothetical protein
LPPSEGDLGLTFSAEIGYTIAIGFYIIDDQISNPTVSIPFGRVFELVFLRGKRGALTFLSAIRSEITLLD